MENKELGLQGKPAEASVYDNEGNYQIVLPCEAKDFHSFITSLLGKPQTLKGSIKGIFDIGYKEIINVYHLVDHRVKQQNQSSLVNFSITVYYDNGTSVTHNNISDFERYYPSESCYPIEILLSFIYLIKFQKNDFAEKQEIETSFRAEPRREENRYFGRHFQNSFEYKVNYTERTWASDISGLLRNHAETFMNKDGNLTKFFHDNFDDIISYSCMLFFILTIIFWCKNTFGYIDKTFIQINSITISSFAKYIVGSFSTISILASILYVIKIHFDYNQYLERNSFIVLVDRDQKRKLEVKNRERRGWIIYTFAWFMSVFSSLLASYIFAKYF